MAILLPDLEYLRELLRYDNGKLFYRELSIKHFRTEKQQISWNKRFAYKQAFTYKNKEGYHTGCIKNREYKAHRVIYYLHHETQPEMIDHKDRNRSNNLIDNLVETTHYLNLTNNGKRRPHIFPMGNRFRARIYVGQKEILLGEADTEVEANQLITDYCSSINSEQFTPKFID